MGDSWDSEDFVIPTETQKPVNDKWDGEDEEVETKDNWDDEEEAKDSSVTSEARPIKKKKKLTEILAEREKRKKAEMERILKEKEEENRTLSPEEMLCEKLRLQKVQQDADLILVSEIMGTKPDADVGVDADGDDDDDDNNDDDNNDDDNKDNKDNKVNKDKEEKTSLNEFDLNSADGLEEFRESLINKIRSTDRLERGAYYVTFVEDLCRSMCDNMEIDDVKRIITVLNALYNDKVKASKVKGKKNRGSKAKLNSGQGAIVDSYAGGYDDYDDFI